MRLVKQMVMTLALAAVSLPAVTQAQDVPCLPQATAADAAAAAAAPLNEAYGQTLEQLIALSGPMANEAPELIGVQADLISQLTGIQQAAFIQSLGGAAQDTGAADAAAAMVDADIAQLQAGLVGAGGQPRPSVTLIANMALQAKDQAQAVASANQNEFNALQALTSCAEAAAGQAGDNATGDGGGDGGGGGE